LGSIGCISAIISMRGDSIRFTKIGVGPLIEANKYPERIHYLNLGLADEDGSRPFKFYADNPSSSHFVASNGTDAVDESWEMVTIRRLDSLVSDGTIGAIDFMKMDAETYEVEILRGAVHFLPRAVYSVWNPKHISFAPRETHDRILSNCMNNWRLMASALTTPALIGSLDHRSCTGFRKKRRMENMCSGQRAGHGSSIFFSCTKASTMPPRRKRSV
jgi:FkbM family methyltransferase